MSGYLQRLIQTAARPSESIHPWRGSVFAPSQQQADFRVHTESEPSAPTAEQASTSQGMPASATRLDRPRPVSLRDEPVSGRANVHEAPSERPVSVQTRTAGKPGFKALLPQTDEEVLRVEAGTFPGIPRRDSSTGEASSSDDDGRPDVTRIARGKVSGSSAAVVRAAQKTEALRSRPSATATRQDQEIQIHIGRIEITAVQPPVSAPVRPRMKEISLDAFLKRGEETGR